MKFIYDRNKETAVIFGDQSTVIKRYKGIKYYSSLLGIKGEKIAVTMENRPEMICSIFSVWDSENTAIVLDSGYTGEQFAYAFSDSEPKYIFTSKKVLERVKEGIEISQNSERY